MKPKKKNWNKLSNFKKWKYVALSVAFISVSMTEKAFCKENEAVKEKNLMQSFKKVNGFDELENTKPVAINFKTLEGKNTTLKTTVKGGILNGKAFGFIIRCEEPETDKLKADLKTNDGNIWADDYAGVYFDVNNAKHLFYQILVNPRGSVYDSRGYTIDYIDSSWNSGIKPETSRGKDYWEARLVVPFESLGCDFDNGDVVGINFERNRRAPYEKGKIGFQAPKSERSFWRPLFATYWNDKSPFGSFYIKYPSPMGYENIRISNHEKKDIDIVSYSRGSLGSYFPEENVFKFEACNNSSKTSDIELSIIEKSLKGDNVLSSKTISVPSKSCRVLASRYIPQDKGNIDFQIKDSAGKILYKSTYKTIPSYPQRIDMPSKPLLASSTKYPELVEDKKDPKLKGSSCMGWMFEWSKKKYMPTAIRFAYAHSQEEWLTLPEKHHFVPVFTVDRHRHHYNSLEKAINFVKSKNIKVAYMPNCYDLKKADFPIIDRKPFIAAPQALEHAEKQLRKALDNYGDVIDHFFLGDEIYYQLLKSSKAIFWKKKTAEKYADLKKKYDLEIKNKYGFGKYGLPDSLEDTNRYKWLAYWKWVNDSVNKYRENLTGIVKEKNKEIVIHSTDPQGGGIFPLDFYRWGKTCDILHHQLAVRPKHNTHLAEFTVKLMRDLSGANEIWPCMHVSDYMSSFDKDEVRELLSRPFRMGATGLLLYQYSHHRRDMNTSAVVFDSICAPERWEAKMEAADIYSKGLRVKAQKTEAAFLISYDSWQANSIDKNEGDSIYVNAFAALGPVSNGWFKFIDDRNMAEGRVDLANYKTLFVPYADIESVEAVKRIRDAVKSGLTLVLFDPDAFTLLPNGNKANDLFKDAKADSTSMPFRFNSNVTAKKLGQGRILHFHENIFKVENPIEIARMKESFQKLLAYLNVKQNKALWKLTLPLKKAIPEMEKGFCLSNNSLHWRQGDALLYNNIPVSGSYRYVSNPPDKDKDANEGWIDFTNGKLTDRVRNITKIKGNPKYFSVSWTNPQTVEIEFKLDYPCRISKVNLWVSGTLPAFELFYHNGASYEKYASFSGGKDPDGVSKVSLIGKNPVDAKLLKLKIGQRSKGNPLRLIEAEIWTDSLTETAGK